MYVCEPTCTHDDTRIPSCYHVLIIGLKETVDELSANAVASVSDHAADITLDVVDVVTDVADTVRR